MQIQTIKGSDRWDRVKTKLRAELGDDAFFNWFGRVDLEGNEGDIVRLSVPTRFLKNWIQSNYNDRLIGLWQRECETVDRIEFIVRGAMRPRPDFASPVYSPAGYASRRAANSNSKITHAGGMRTGAAAERNKLADVTSDAATDLAQGAALNAKYTFETFVEGNSNGLAYAAARQIANEQTNNLDLLYLHAGVGFGKTHLLQAVAASARASGKKVLYLTAEYFMYQLVPALKTRMYPAFRQALESIDLLLIDDIQLLHGKQLPHDFCQTLKMLMETPRHIIIASDRPPLGLDTLTPDIVQRLAGGLIVGIQDPDFKLRRDILTTRALAAKRHYPSFEVPNDVLDYVARYVVSSGRDLDGALNRLLAHSQLTKLAVCREMAERTLHDLIGSVEPRSVKIEDIQQAVCKHYHVARADLLSSWRARTIVRPRQIAMYLAKVMTARSLPEIGRRFGNRDHTTVLHAVRKIEKQIKVDRALGQEIDLLKRLVHP